MAILQEMRCVKCCKTTWHEYIPAATLEESYWKCLCCCNDERFYNTNFHKFDLEYYKERKKRS